MRADGVRFMLAVGILFMRLVGALIGVLCTER